MDDIKIKVATLILLIISFILVFCYTRQKTYVSNISIEEIKETRKLDNNLISSLKINNINTVYDKVSDTYFYTVPLKYENSNYTLRVDVDNGYDYKINNKSNNSVKIDYDKPLNIIIYNDKNYCEVKVQLTNLPLLKINSESVINTDDVKSTFEYIDGETKSKEYNSKIHIRGATSLRVPKKSYKVDIYDKEYEKTNNISINGFSKLDSFILDGIYKDTSKIRNVLSTELWNSVSRDFLEVSINSKFVELFINNEYKGLYVLTEPINRKKLKLKKTENSDTSVIIKDTSWYTVNEFNDIDINSMSYKGYEIKYPNTSDFNEQIWNKVLGKLSYYYNNETSYDVVKEVFNINNYIDFILFNAFTNNTDNKLAKNNYYYMESISDEEIFIQPWDMEFTYGLVYTSETDKYSLKTIDDYNEIKVPFDFDYKLKKMIIKRYWELRKTVLTKEYLDKLLDKYLNDLNKGAANRDSEIWYEYNIDEEIKEIRNWIYNRLDFFDKYMKELENE